MKHYEQKATWLGITLFGLHTLIIHHPKKNLGHEQKQRQEITLYNGLLSISYSLCYFTQLRNTFYWMVFPIICLTPSHQSWIKNIPQRPNCWRCYVNWSFSFQIKLDCVIYKNTQLIFLCNMHLCICESYIFIYLYITYINLLNYSSVCRWFLYR